MKKPVILLTIIFIFFCSCRFGDKNETNLTKEDLEFIKKIIPLEKNEKIEMFETNGGLKALKTSGNFISDRRIASYWIDGKNDDVNSVEYKYIDSIKLFDRTKALTHASYLQIYSSGKADFKVYIDSDSIRTWSFFNKAMENWNNKK